MVQPIPDGYHTITPYLIVKDGAAAIEFYAKAFGAEEVMRIPAPDGKGVAHAELRVGNSMLMLAGEYPDYGCVSPQTIGGTPVSIHLYVNNVDAAFDRAVKAGAKVEMPLADQFWGDRMGKLVDPFGHKWSMATHIKDVAHDACSKAAAEAMGDHGCCEHE